MNGIEGWNDPHTLPYPKELLEEFINSVDSDDYQITTNLQYEMRKHKMTDPDFQGEQLSGSLLANKIAEEAAQLAADTAALAAQEAEANVVDDSTDNSDSSSSVGDSEVDDEPPVGEVEVSAPLVESSGSDVGLSSEPNISDVPVSEPPVVSS